MFPGPSLFPGAVTYPGATTATVAAAALKPFDLGGLVTGVNYGGQVIGLNIEDYTGNGYGGSVT